jgi:pimeloyl-ACP methyl ester carboxylesterase
MNGTYGGWTHAGNARIYVRVPTRLKERASQNGSFDPNGNGHFPDLDATPIVLVHGLSSSRNLRPLIRALGSDRPVYAPDLPGFGLSDQPIHPLDIPGLAYALRRWLLQNQLAPAIVVGVSFGCQVAVDLASRHPATVDRLVLVGPTTDPKGRSMGHLALRWARNLARTSPRLAPTFVHNIFDAGPSRNMWTLRRALEDRVEDKLSGVEAPTLVVRPQRDHLVPEEWAERVAKLIPDSELVTLPKTGHSLGSRAANRLSALIDPFLAEEWEWPQVEQEPEVNEVPEVKEASEPASL